MFVEGVDPIELAPHGMDIGHTILNPRDNLKNLPESYLRSLESLPKRHRQRFLDGLYLSDVDGALWTDGMINDAKVKVSGEIVKTVIAVDPSVSSSATSDECGIVACSLDEFGDGIVNDDLTAKLSTRVWAQTVVNAYYKYDANEVVAEVNQGGDLVEDAIRNIDPNIKVVKVHASKGKFARAEPVSMLYEQGKVGHAKSMPDLESEMTEWVPMQTKESPNRIDAVTWGITHLMIKPVKRREVRAMVIGQ
jgi:phage terminase large subunit-like protein